MMHTVYDQLIPPQYGVTNFENMVHKMGKDQFLTVKITNGQAHCAFTPEQTGQAFDALRLWALTAQSQIVHDSILIEGNYRTFHFLKPAKDNASIVFVLHGSGGDGQQMRARTTKLEGIAPTENILLVYPDGYKRYWNECRKTANSEANHLNINEESFFNGMIDYFDKIYKINKKHIFAVGTSGGGHMAYKLALTMPDKFKAITALIANLPDH